MAQLPSWIRSGGVGSSSCVVDEIVEAGVPAIAAADEQLVRQAAMLAPNMCTYAVRGCPR